MKFELTISGLCILAMKSTEAQPVHPEAVDVIVPSAHHHKCRFVWDPNEANPSREANLVVGPDGRRYASLDLSQQALQQSLKISFENNSTTQHTVHWGAEEAEQPSGPWEETQMNWVPRLEALGFEGFSVPSVSSVPSVNDVPGGASARLSLDFGTFQSRQMITDADTNAYILWKFDNDAFRRALANEVVYTVDGVDTVIVSDAAGEIVRMSLGPFQTARMCISNDMEKVPTDFTSDIIQLDHLSHLDAIAGGTFVVPEIFSTPRTGHKVCGQVVYVYGG